MNSWISTAQSLDLRLNTRFAGLGGLSNHRIYWRDPQGNVAYEAADVFESTKVRKVLLPTTWRDGAGVALPGPWRVWAYAEGAGGLVYVGKPVTIRLSNPGAD